MNDESAEILEMLSIGGLLTKGQAESDRIMIIMAAPLHKGF